jgi:DNA-binding SARP family transcriptional activator
VTIQITLLGKFEVRRDLSAVPAGAWSRRHAAALVKLLALTPGRRLHREQVIDALWPDLAVDEAAPRLHKAAHFARRAAGADAIVLGGESVSLFPDRFVAVDVALFEAAADEALRSGDEALLRAASERCAGDLLPEDLYEEWADAPRRRIRQLRADLLRRLRCWDAVVQLDPTDEEAHLELIRAFAARGDRHGALRQFERLDRALAGELGVAPSKEAIALRDALVDAGVAEPAPTVGDDLVGRDEERTLISTLLAAVGDGEGGRTLLLAGPAGVGKSALLAWARSAAESRSWRTGHGVAASIEGAWAYAPILEAVADLVRRHPTLLDGLDDNYRTEIERALAGDDLHWSGEGGHQRLFVAVAELLRLAATDHCALLVLDDLHDADEATLRLTHYLARCAVNERIALAIAYRPMPLTDSFDQFLGSLTTRAAAVVRALEPLTPAQAEQLVRRHQPDATADTVVRIAELAGGSPFAVVELARRAGTVPSWEQAADSVALAALGPKTRDILQRVAVLGTTFDTDEFVSLADLADDAAFVHLDAALGAGVLEHTGTHYRFRHSLVRDALTADVAPHRRRRIHHDAAARLKALGASPARIGHHLVEAGDPAAAGPHLVRAAEREAAVGAYRDAFKLVERVQAHVEGPLRARALALRADLLFALGDPSAPVAYRHAIELADGDGRRLLRARLARAAVVAGDMDTAAAALDQLEPNGGPADGDILLARSQVAYFTGDLETAWAIAEDARRRVLGGDKSWQVLDLVALQGLLAHSRGEWFDRMRVELQRIPQNPELALAIFDGYLCPAEYLLYGPTPYGEVIELAQALRDSARRSGVLRAEAFACALAGEAALLAGDLPTAQRELEEAVDLHHDIGAAAGEAASLQRLAEVHLARGDAGEPNRLLQRSLPLARWSAISLHLLQRIFGTMIRAAPDPDAARAVVDRAESTLGTEDSCPFCNIMLAVPAVIACADVGDLDHARHHLQVAEKSLQLWEGTSWQAAVLEARAHLADAEGDTSLAHARRAEAAALFDGAGQPLDAARCRTASAP